MRTRLLVVIAVAAFSSPLFAQQQQQRPLAANAFRYLTPQLAQIISDAAKTYGVDPNLVAAVAFHESRFNPNDVAPSTGATGIMQLKPSTGLSLGASNLFDPRQNVFAGTKYLKKQLDRFGGDVDSALAAYNKGAAAVQQSGPSVAERYVSKVKGYYFDALRRSS
jgi:soluble lytic murein transglycosylase-like protein